MSLYKKEDEKFLSLAMESIYHQTTKPKEVVLVHDGGLNESLYRVLDSWREKLNIVDVKLETNQGLGRALNIGLQHCSCDYVARFDTDDINHPTRFEKQLDFLKSNPDVSLCGGHIAEFNFTPEAVSGHRTVKIGGSSVMRINRQNPFNHMTVMFKKQCVLDVGGYQHLHFMEDYYLWLRLHAANKKLINIDEVLVYARVGNGMLERRRGAKYAKSEFQILSKIFKLGVCRKPSTIAFFSVRAGLRLLPESLLTKVYKKTRSSHYTNHSTGV
ncbi:glycosyltransferase [Enterovibrio baiacu]|uniref:glycosyltransferase n=1 Tax=Enterovibrio baiacu TaxID=2491023 RepID=UPI003D0CEAC6